MTETRAESFKDAALFQRALVEQGHLFQHRALHEAVQAFATLGSGWDFQSIEFPVQAKTDTRIDFILRDHEIFLTVECKRVNPAWGRWVFATAPLTRRQKRGQQIIFEGVSKQSRDHTEVHVRQIPWEGRPVCQIGYEVRTDKKGNLKDSKDALEKTLRQATMGACGLINYFAEVPQAMPFKQPHFVIPVVFTTAELVMAHVDMAKNVDILDGTVDADDLTLEQVEWVFFEYHVEPGLRKPIHNQLHGKNLSEDLDLKYTRTIPIVTAGAIGQFLTRLNRDLMTD